MAGFDPDAYLKAQAPFDPDAFLANGAEPPKPKSDKPPEMFLSLPDANGRMTAEPRTTYNQPEKPVGIIQRAREGAAGPMEGELGFSAENLKKYPWLSWMQPAARSADVAMRTPASIWGGASGAVAGAAEPVIGSAQANRLQRDVTAAPMAISPEIPAHAPNMAREAPVRPAAQPRLPAEPPPLPPHAYPDLPRKVERPDVGVSLLPAEVPHAPYTGAGSRSLSAAGHGGPLADVSPDTIAHLRSVMREQGFTPHTIDQRLSELSSHHFFGEITPSLEADMSAIAGPPGPGKLEVMGSTRQRHLEAPERTRNIFDRGFGVNENVAQLQKIIEGDRARAADPFYRQFRNTEVTPTNSLEVLMPRLQASGALQAANKALEIEGIPSSKGFLEMRGGEVDATRVPTATAFQFAKEHLDAKIGSELAAASPDMNTVRRYTQLRNDLVEALDNHPQMGDTWKKAREAYAQPSELLDAMRVGQRVLTGHITAEELPFLTAAYSEPQMKALRIGMRGHLEGMLGKRANLTQETINTVLSPNNVSKLRWALGDAATDSMVAAMEHEQHMHGAPTRIHGGSPTAFRQEALKRWTPQKGKEGVSLSDVTGFIKHPFRSAATTGAEIAGERMAGKRTAAEEARLARIREEASRVFTLQGPERDAVARYLVGEEGKGFARGGIARAAGGAVHNHSPSEAQKKAGNYAKTHKSFHGLDITLENLKGKSRSGIGRNGKKWSVKMPAHYGYIKRTEGADGDHVDVYLGPNEKSDQVFVVDQKDAETGKFDEHKCLLGFNSEAEARQTYRAGFSDGKDRIKHMRRMSLAEFKEWVAKGDTSKEIRRYANGGAVRKALQSLKTYAEGGAPGDDYNTPVDETAFQGWKAQNAPNDSGVDYDLRGAYLADMQRAENGHMGDRFKKPNHPTFSDQSQYATGEHAARAGHWIGETYVPPAAMRADGGPVRRALQSLKDYADGGEVDGGAPAEKVNWAEIPRLNMVMNERSSDGAPSNPALWGAAEDDLPHSGIGMGPIARGIGHLAKRVFWDLPKEAVTAAKETPYGLRREDFTDVPPDTTPDPNSPLGGVGINVPRGAGSHLDPMISPSLEAGLNVMGGTSLSAPAKAGEVVAGAGPVRHLMIENQDALKELANQRRARGWSTGKSAPGWDFKRPDAEKGSWERAVQEARAGFKSDADRAMLEYERTAPGNPYMKPDDWAFMDNNIRQGRAAFGSGAVDKRGAAAAVANEVGSMGTSPKFNFGLGESSGSRTVKLGPTEITYGVNPKNNDVELSLIRTDKNKRGEGNGRAAMEQFLKEADDAEKRVLLNADPMDKSTSKAKLENFYKSLGFVRNSGRNKDFTTRAEYIRNPFLEDKGKSVTLGAGAGDKRGAVAAAAPIWRSAVEDAIETLPLKAAPADQWANTLKNAKGIKPEEMDWLGLQDFFAAKKAAGEKVTKQEVLDHVAGNKIELQDVVRGGDRPITHTITSAGMSKNGMPPPPAKFNSRAEAEAELAKRESEYPGAYHNYAELPTAESKTKYHSYQLPGGENYREHLLTMPEKGRSAKDAAADRVRDISTRMERIQDEFDAIDRAPETPDLAAKRLALYNEKTALNKEWQEQHRIATAEDTSKYRSSHWDEPNVLAHVRTNDRIIGDKKSLHLEEVQSDMHQAGRKYGYKLTEAERARWEKVKNKDDKDLTPQDRADIEAFGGDRTLNSQAVPNAPFKDTDAWTGLAMKRMIRHAAENGYDRISWTPGEAQAARYDLSKHVDEVYAKPVGDGKFDLTVQGKNGEQIYDTGRTGPVDQAKLADTLGKEMADKIAAQTKEHTYSGLDLKVGGEGMREFYDKMLPKIAEKIGKKHGVKVKTEKVPLPPKENFTQRDGNGRPVMEFPSQDVHYFDIPPSLKEQALKGMNMFRSGGRVKLGKPRDRSAALQIAYSGKRT